MSNVNILQQSDKLKERGNALFKSGKAHDALTSYNQAIFNIETILSHGNNFNLSSNDEKDDNDVPPSAIYYKYAVLISNKSNCLFEIGRYNKSIIYANKCIEILANSVMDDDSSTQVVSISLKWKNLLRIVRCGIYNDNGVLGDSDNTPYQTTILQHLEILMNCGESSYEKRAKRMLSQVKAHREILLKKKRDTGVTPRLPSIHRASMFGSWTREFYNYGHDQVTSALGEGYYNVDGNPACPSIELSKLPEEHLSNVNILFGGVGDARNVYTTLCDANMQYNSCLLRRRKHSSLLCCSMMLIQQH